MFEETLEECERLLVSAEHEALQIRRTADAAAKRQAETLVAATTTAIEEITRSTDQDRAAMARFRIEAERDRLDTAKLKQATKDRLFEIMAEREALRAERETIDSTLSAAERMRADAEHVQHQAREISDTLIAAAEARAELLEATLDDRIAEVEATLGSLQNVVLDRQRPVADEHAMLKGILSTAYREIHAYRNAELAAANRQADALIARAQHAAAQIAAGPLQPVPELVTTDPPAIPPPPAFTEPTLPPPPLPPEPLTTPTVETSAIPNDPPEEPNGSDLAETLQGALAPPNGNGTMTDSELADALMLDRTSDENEPGDDGWTEGLDHVISPNATNTDEVMDAAVSAVHEQFEGNGTPPKTEHADDDADVTIDLASGDGATLTLDGSTSAADDDAEHQSVGRFRSLWRAVF